MLPGCWCSSRRQFQQIPHREWRSRRRSRHAPCPLASCYPWDMALFGKREKTMVGLWQSQKRCRKIWCITIRVVSSCGAWSKKTVGLCFWSHGIHTNGIFTFMGSIVENISDIAMSQSHHPFILQSLVTYGLIGDGSTYLGSFRACLILGGWECLTVQFMQNIRISKVNGLDTPVKKAHVIQSTNPTRWGPQDS